MDQDVQLLVSRARRLIQKVRDNPSKSPISDYARELHALRDAADRLEHGAPQPERTPYEAKTRKTHRDDGEIEERHESFGMVGFSRCSGQMKLFGSSLPKHAGYIAMRVYRARRIHGLSQDWMHTDGRTPIVEIALSAAQFAEAITSMNMGEGVPCTIQSVEGISMEKVPEEVTPENVKIMDGFESKLTTVVDSLKKAHAEMETVVENKSTISKGRAREMTTILARALQEVRANMPFVLSQFQESAQKVVTHAKAEVEAFTHLTLRNAGMEHLRLQAGDVLGNPELTEGEET